MATSRGILLSAVVAQLAALPAAAAQPSPAPEPAPAGPGVAIERPFSARSLTLSLDGEHLRSRGSEGERFSDGGLSLRASTALAGRLRLEDQRFSGWGLIGGIEAREFTTDLPEVADDRFFLRLGLSLAGFYAPSAQDVFWLQLGASTAEQASLLYSPQLLPSAVALGAHRFGPGLRVLYGFGYTYRFGPGLPLPFAGVDWRFAPGWRLDVLLPAHVQVSVEPTDQLSFGLALTASGDRFRYHAVDPTSGVESRQKLRFTRLRLGPSAEYAASSRVHLRLDAGAEGARVDTGLSSRRAVGGFVGLTLRLGGRAPAHGDPGGEL